MTQPLVESLVAPAPPVAGRGGAQLQGPLLALARATWLVIATLTLILVLVTFSSQYEKLATPCTGPDCPFLVIVPGDLPALTQAGLSMSVVGAYMMTWRIAFLLVSLAIGTALFWRK